MTKEIAIHNLYALKQRTRALSDHEALDLAIKALEQEPSNNNWKFYYDHGYAQAKRDLLCENCISREAVLMEIDKYLCGVPFDEKGIDEVIKDLPPVTPTAKWIPVSERLPEIHQDVILSLRSLDIVVGFRAKTEPYFYCYGADSCYIEPQNVLAWMPLPEPYKSESEEE